MHVVPPLVESAQVGGKVYLLRWIRYGPRDWRADIAWVQWDGQKWIPVRDVVPAKDIRKLDGQAYKAVPRFTLAEVRRDEERRRQ